MVAVAEPNVCEHLGRGRALLEAAQATIPLRRQRELLGDARFDELLRTQLDETSIANLKDYLSSAAIDDQGLQRHLSEWEPVIAAVVATVEGNDDAATTLPPLLGELGATSDWSAWVACCAGSSPANAASSCWSGWTPPTPRSPGKTLRRLSDGP